MSNLKEACLRHQFLLQRLDRKPQDPSSKLARAFGGGMMGLRDEEWDLLQQVFSIHYMGAAEYEFGAMSKALRELVLDRDRLCTFEVVLRRQDIKLNYETERRLWKERQEILADCKKRGVKPPRKKPYKEPDFEPRTVYVLCREEYRDLAECVIRLDAQGKLHTKRPSDFSSVLDPCSDRDREAVGWFELTTGFFFFVDAEVFRATCDMFIESKDV